MAETKGTIMDGATKRPWGLWSEEGRTKTGRYRHSVCANGTEPLDGELQVAGEENWHKCVAYVLGDTEAEALANASLIVAAVNAYNLSRDALLAEAFRTFDVFDGTERPYQGTLWTAFRKAFLRLRAQAEGRG